MTQFGDFDYLAIINGPEDGAEFPIHRSPITVGAATACLARVHADRSVQDVHAILSPVSDGYRIRSTTLAPAFVNERRAGRVFSRTMKSGDTLRVGNTELILRCAPGGLAARSRGLIGESDFAWLLKSLGEGGFRLLRRVAGLLPPLLLTLARHWLLLTAVTAVASFVFVPNFRLWVLYMFRRLLTILN